MTFVHEQLRDQRWVPPWLRYQNLARYEWAAQYVPGRRVLEVGCGSGQGTRLLATAGASHVDGVDISESAIEHARQAHADQHLTFHLASGQQLPVAAASYDVVVALETLEHVDDDDLFLREIVRVIRPDGRFLCSTPNRAVTNPGTAISNPPFNPHHVREYTSVELGSLLRRYFVSVDLLGQTAYRGGYVVLLSRVGRVVPLLAVRLHQCRKLLSIPGQRLDQHRPVEMRDRREPEVLVAVCSSPVGKPTG
jgi:SAM-dependent methyltransferase